MFCSSCGGSVLDNAKFCSQCGTQVGGGEQLIQESSVETPVSSLRSAYSLASKSVSNAMNGAKKIGGIVATQLTDLNGDGKIDAEDFKIAAARAKKLASAAYDEAVILGKNTLKSDLVKEAASGAAVGAVIAIPIPVIGPATGAVVGASLGAYKYFTKK